MLAVCRGAAQDASLEYPRLVYPYLEKEMSLATPIPVQRLCVLAQVSRAGFYRWRQAPPAVDADLDLRDAIQKIALEWPSYGWRRITAELHRRGWKANHKRVLRVMREGNLLCLRRPKFLGAPTDPKPSRRGFSKLAGQVARRGFTPPLLTRIPPLHSQLEIYSL